jgi:ureidoacrylate peracid hydrolase
MARRPLPLTREVPLRAEEAALLVIDVQNHSCRREGGCYAGLSDEAFALRYGWFFERLHATVLPNLAQLLAAFRAARAEVIYTVIESLTRDGRDRSLDYKISGIDVRRGAWDALPPEEVAPAADEIVLPKTSSSVFISTNIHYLLGNLGIRQLVIAGLLTDQCVDSAVRDACDLGYLVTVVPDACATHSQERHDWSLRNNRGYARQAMTSQILSELAGSPPA